MTEARPLLSTGGTDFNQVSTFTIDVESGDKHFQITLIELKMMGDKGC